MPGVPVFIITLIKWSARLGMTLSIVMLGMDCMGDEGERQYNKYMHSLRKMQFPNTKPSDPSWIPGSTWNDFNKNLITLNGILLCLGAACILFKQF